MPIIALQGSPSGDNIRIRQASSNEGGPTTWDKVSKFYRDHRTAIHLVGGLVFGLGGVAMMGVGLSDAFRNYGVVASGGVITLVACRALWTAFDEQEEVPDMPPPQPYPKDIRIQQKHVSFVVQQPASGEVPSRQEPTLIRTKSFEVESFPHSRSELADQAFYKEYDDIYGAE